MTEATLDENQSHFIGALTIAAAQRLGSETFLLEEDNGVRPVRIARRRRRAHDHPADAAGPRSINAYLAEVLDFAAHASGGADAKRFKIDPQRLLYSLQVEAQRHAARLPFAARARSGDLVRFRRHLAAWRTDPT